MRICLIAVIFISLFHFCFSESSFTSQSGNIGFDATSDGNVEMKIYPTGEVTIGGVGSSNTLNVGGNIFASEEISSPNLNIGGALYLKGIETVSSNVTLSGNSMVMVNTSSDNIKVTLPSANLVKGRIYNIKKTSLSNTVTINGGGNVIDLNHNYILNSGNVASVEVVSNGAQWYILGQPPAGTSLWTPYEISTSLWLDSSESSGVALNLAGELGVMDLTANSGINPKTGVAWAVGDTYRLVFVSSTRRDATSSNIADYNTHVQSAANAAGFGSITWKAIGSTSSINALVNTNAGSGNTDGAFFLMDGSTIIADDITDLWDNNQLSGDAIGINESGIAIATHDGPWGTFSGVWTGTSGNGLSSSLPLGNSTVTLGVADGSGTGGQWLNRSSGANSGLAYIYAVSEVLTVVNKVTQWNDKSGYGNHAVTQSDDPLYMSNSLNGMAGVKFDNTRLSGANSITIAFVIAIIKANDSTWNNGFHAIIDRKTGTRLGGIMSTNNTGFYAGDGNGELRYNGVVYSAGAVWPSINSAHMRSYVVTGSSPISNTGYSTGNMDSSSTGGDGTHYEIIALDSIPSEEDRKKLEGYLAHKWGLEAGLPAGHPYKNVAP